MVAAMAFDWFSAARCERAALWVQP